VGNPYNTYFFKCLSWVDAPHLVPLCVTCKLSCAEGMALYVCGMGGARSGAVVQVWMKWNVLCGPMKPCKELMDRHTRLSIKRIWIGARVLMPRIRPPKKSTTHFPWVCWDLRVCHLPCMLSKSRTLPLTSVGGVGAFISWVLFIFL